MLAQGLTYFKNLELSVLGMLLFLAAFIAVTIWTFMRAGSREFYQKLAEGVLEDEEESHERRR